MSRFSLTKSIEVGRVGDADVEVAVGREDHAVDAALDLVLLGELIGELDALGAGGRAAGPEVVERAR